MKTPYFKDTGGPPPLHHCLQRTVRFEEVDALGIVWHGRYAGYFEEGRVALGLAYGIGYKDFRDHGLATPVKVFHADYLLPLEFGDQFTVRTKLHWTEAARMNFEYEIANAQGELATRGYSVHVIVDFERRLQIFCPDFYSRLLERWRRGDLEDE